MHGLPREPVSLVSSTVLSLRSVLHPPVVLSVVRPRVPGPSRLDLLPLYPFAPTQPLKSESQPGVALRRKSGPVVLTSALKT